MNEKSLDNPLDMELTGNKEATHDNLGGAFERKGRGR
jgi:hypothetical protein